MKFEEKQLTKKKMKSKKNNKKMNNQSNFKKQTSINKKKGNTEQIYNDKENQFWYNFVIVFSMFCQ